MSYQEKAKRLKKLGLVKYDLRKGLTSGQKSNITKLEKKFKLLLNRPGEFSSISISSKRAVAIGGEAFKIKTGKKTRVYYLGKIKEVKRDSITINHKGFTNKIYDKQKGDIFKRSELIEKKLKPNELLTITIGGRQWNKKFLTHQALNSYLNDWVPRDVEQSSPDFQKHKEYLLGHMVVTTLDIPDTGIKRGSKKAGIKASGNRRGN